MSRERGAVVSVGMGVGWGGEERGAKRKRQMARWSVLYGNGDV